MDAIDHPAATSTSELSWRRASPWLVANCTRRSIGKNLDAAKLTHHSTFRLFTRIWHINMFGYEGLCFMHEWSFFYDYVTRIWYSCKWNAFSADKLWLFAYSKLVPSQAHFVADDWIWWDRCDLCYHPHITSWRSTKGVSDLWRQSWRMHQGTKTKAFLVLLYCTDMYT